MLLKWGGYRGERWRWHSEQQAYFRFCKDCHLEAWPEDSGPKPALAPATATAAAANDDGGGGGGGDSGDGGGKKGAAAARTKSSVRRDVQKGGKANLGKPKNPRANKK